MTVQDTPAQIVILFQLGVTLLTTYFIWDKLMGFNFFSTSIAMQKAGTALSVLDYGMVFTMAGLFLSSIYFASRIRTSKLFLPLSFTVLLFSSWIAAVFSNVWKVIVGSSVLGNVANSLPYASKILLNLPLLIFASGSLIIIALYTRIGGGRRAAR